MGKGIFEKAVEKGSKTEGDAYHEGADDGKESVAFVQSGKRGGEKGKLVQFDKEEE